MLGIRRKHTWILLMKNFVILVIKYWVQPVLRKKRSHFSVTQSWIWFSYGKFLSSLEYWVQFLLEKSPEVAMLYNIESASCRNCMCTFFSKPYWPGFTRIDPRCNPCQFLRIPWLRYGEKSFWVMLKIFCKDFKSVLISILNRFKPHRPASTFSAKVHRHLSLTAWHS